MDMSHFPISNGLGTKSQKLVGILVQKRAIAFFFFHKAIFNFHVKDFSQPFCMFWGSSLCKIFLVLAAADFTLGKRLEMQLKSLCESKSIANGAFVTSFVPTAMP
jgi:hypothetical protein